MVSSRPLLALLAVTGIAAPLIALGAAGPPAAQQTAGPSTPSAPAPVFGALPASIAEPSEALTPTNGREGRPAPAPDYANLRGLGVVVAGDGRLRPVQGGTPQRGTGPLQTYSVAVEGGLRVTPEEFAAGVDRILGDPRSWGADGRRSFQRVAAGEGDFRVVLASPRTTDKLCVPLTTKGTLSCAVGTLAVINVLRWQRGADDYQGQLRHYREYVINHEVGHVLGYGHAQCPGPGQRAPVMMQQTIGIGACRVSSWPYPYAR